MTRDILDLYTAGQVCRGRDWREACLSEISLAQLVSLAFLWTYKWIGEK